MEVSDAIKEAVKDLGYKSLSSEQEAAVKHFVGGSDVFVCLPTGSGKSLCYSILPLVFDKMRGVKGLSMAVIVSPLIALMQDQVNSMMKRKVSSIYVRECDETICDADKIAKGHYQLLFISPEMLLMNLDWRDLLQSHVFRDNLVALVIDEAHCVTKW